MALKLLLHQNGGLRVLRTVVKSAPESLRVAFYSKKGVKSAQNGG